jgi:hypothetical protein
MKTILFLLTAILAAGAANICAAQTTASDPHYVMCNPQEAQIVLTVLLSRDGKEQSHSVVHLRRFQPKDRTAPPVTPSGIAIGHDNGNDSYHSSSWDFVDDRVVINFWSTENSSNVTSSTVTQVRVPFGVNFKETVDGITYDAMWTKAEANVGN